MPLVFTVLISYGDWIESSDFTMMHSVVWLLTQHTTVWYRHDSDDHACTALHCCMALCHCMTLYSIAQCYVTILQLCTVPYMGTMLQCYIYGVAQCYIHTVVHNATSIQQCYQYNVTIQYTTVKLDSTQAVRCSPLEAHGSGVGVWECGSVTL